MTPEMSYAPAARPRVSILARIIPALSYALPALGAALSALLFINVMRAMRNAESAGVVALAGGMSEANLAIVVTLYLAILLGFVGLVIGIVRIFSATKADTPSGWFFLITGIIGIAPMVSLWQAQSLLLEVVFSRTGRPEGIAGVAREITLLLMIALCLGLISALVLLIASVVPLPSILRARRKWAPVVFMVIMEILIIVMTVGYHMRTAWLYNQYRERF